MTDDIDNLSGPELSEVVAVEVMGWELEEGEFGDDEKCWLESGNPRRSFTGWRPDDDRNDAYSVLMRCEELGLQRNVYSNIYADALDFTRVSHVGWFLLTCNPSIICRAAIRAVREARK